MNSEEKMQLLDILYDRNCNDCDHAYNCTGFGNPCSSWIRITSAGMVLRDFKGVLNMETEVQLMEKQREEHEERRRAEYYRDFKFF